MKPSLFKIIFSHGGHNEKTNTGLPLSFGFIPAAVLFVMLSLFPWRNVHAQAKVQVQGIVRDGQTNEALIGVGILEETGKTARAVGVTDNSGKFSVNVGPDATLVFRYVGYSDYKVKV